MRTTMRTMSVTEFDSDPKKAVEATSEGPLFITEDDRPAYVVLTIDQFRKLVQSEQSIVQQLGLPAGVGDIDFEPPRLKGIHRPVDWS